ncbi:MAG: DUF4416 family protein [Pirellulaceae bacterium]
MGGIRPHYPVLLITAVFSRHHEAIDWGRARLEERYGPIALESERFEFTETSFYHASMGDDLLKTFFAFERRIEPLDLVDIKLHTNQLEEECRALGRWPEPRPLNLDPGYISEAKLVLATTKDRDHRLYLDRGVYAEVTLHYHHKAWRKREWTYPDYQRADFHAFFDRCRQYLRAVK